MSMLESLRNGINVWDPYLLVCIVLLVVCFTVPFHKKRKIKKQIRDLANNATEMSPEEFFNSNPSGILLTTSGEECVLLGILVPDILFHHFPAHIPQGTHKITVAPQMSAPELLVPDFRMHHEKLFRAMSFQIFDDICRGIFRLKAYQQVDMIRHHFHLLDGDPFLFCQLGKDCFHIIYQILCRECRVPVLCHPD